MTGAAAVGPQVADGDGHRGFGMQRLTERIQRQRLDMVLDIGGLMFGRRPGEDTELTGRHGHRSGLIKDIFGAHRHAAKQRCVAIIQGLRTGDAKDGADLKMILKVLAHPGHFVAHLDAVGAQHLGRSDARKLEDVRGCDGPRGQNRFLPRLGSAQPALMAEQDALRLAVLQQD